MSSPLADFRHIGTKIVCVARNYGKHVAEMGYVNPEKPVVFGKTLNTYLAEGEGELETPEGCELLHHEVELGLVIAKKGRWIKKEEAMDYIGGYTIVLDMTARDLQAKLREAQQPWYLSKSFDTSCAVGKFVDAKSVPDPHALDIYCKVNGELRQKASTSEMLFDIPTLLEYVTKYVSLERGDMVLTGTPDGVGSCLPGDVLDIGIEGHVTAQFTVGPKRH